MFDILHRVGIRAPKDQVYAALSTPAGLARWWTAETGGDACEGGQLKFLFTADGKVLGGFEMSILELAPERRVQWRVTQGPPEWLDTRISFDLREEADYTIVLFRHEGWREPVEFMYHGSTKWATFLMSLKSLGETGRGQPSPDDVRVGDWH